MRHIKAVFPISVATAVVLAYTAPARAQIIISDGNFTNWTYNSFGSGGVATAMLEATGGDPGANIQITTNSPTGLEGATAIKTDYMTTGIGFDGSAFTFSIDVSNSANSFGNGQQIELLVDQGGNIYGDHLGKTGIGPNPPDYYAVSFNGTIAASGFSLLSGSGPATPDFSGATTTEFGFGAYNVNTVSLTQSYDNYYLNIAPPSSTPEPGSVAWLLTSLTSASVLARRRRKKVA